MMSVHSGSGRWGRFAVSMLVTATVTGFAACSSGPPPPVETQSYDARMAEHRRISTRFPGRTRTTLRFPKPRADCVSRVGLLPGRRRLPRPGVAHRRTRRSAGRHRTAHVAEHARPLRAEAATRKLPPERRGLHPAAFATEAEGLQRLFVPFGDLTNRTETYHGGRYLKPRSHRHGAVRPGLQPGLQPNRVYNVNYICPIPPAENRLQVAIRAGERMRP